MTRIYFMISLIVLFGCSKKERVKEYYEDGSLLKTYYEIEGKVNGEYREYYKNGNVKVQGIFKQGKANGIFKEFSENGELIKEGHYFNDQAIGWFLYFESGKIKMKRQYILINDRPYINQFIIYGLNGEIVKDSSNYISVEKTDVANKYIIRLESSMFNSDYMEVLVGEFNDNFRPINPSKIDTIKLKGTLEVVAELKENEKAVVCDILVKDSERQIRFIYFDPDFWFQPIESLQTAIQE